MYWSLRCIKHFALSVISVFVSLLFPKLTAGTPYKGLSNTLNYSVPGRGISGLLRGWFFPLFSTVFTGAFFVVLFVSRRPRARSLVMIFFRTKSLQMLSNGVIGKGKTLALHVRSLRPKWFPRESLTPPLKMLFSEIPVASWPGNSLFHGYLNSFALQCF